MLVAGGVAVERLGLQPMARSSATRRRASIRRSWESAPCRRRAGLLAETGVSLDDVDLIELNEAFAAQGPCVRSQLHFDHAKLKSTAAQSPRPPHRLHRCA